MTWNNMLVLNAYKGSHNKLWIKQSVMINTKYTNRKLLGSVLTGSGSLADTGNIWVPVEVL